MRALCWFNGGKKIAGEKLTVVLNTALLRMTSLDQQHVTTHVKGQSVTFVRCMIARGRRSIKQM